MDAPGSQGWVHSAYGYKEVWKVFLQNDKAKSEVSDCIYSCTHTLLAEEASRSIRICFRCSHFKDTWLGVHRKTPQVPWMCYHLVSKLTKCVAILTFVRICVYILCLLGRLNALNESCSRSRAYTFPLSDAGRQSSSCSRDSTSHYDMWCSWTKGVYTHFGHILFIFGHILDKNMSKKCPKCVQTYNVSHLCPKGVQVMSKQCPSLSIVSKMCPNLSYFGQFLDNLWSNKILLQNVQKVSKICQKVAGLHNKEVQMSARTPRVDAPSLVSAFPYSYSGGQSSSCFCDFTSQCNMLPILLRNLPKTSSNPPWKPLYDKIDLLTLECSLWKNSRFWSKGE